MESYLILVGLGIFSYFAHNSTVTASTILLLLLKVILPQDKLMYFGSHGLNWGVILLTAAMLSPMALGSVGMKDIVAVFKSPEGILSVIIGMIVAIFGKWGVETMSGDPQIVVSIMVGTILGVVLLKGLPVGPLIASGIVYACLKVLHLLFH